MKHYKNLEEYKLKNPDKVKNGVITISEDICLDLYLGKEIRDKYINMLKETQNKWEEYIIFHPRLVWNDDMKDLVEKVETEAYQRGKEEIDDVVFSRKKKLIRLQTLEEVEKIIPEVEYESIYKGVKQYSNINHAINEYRRTVLQTINKMK